jgi:DNA-binding transcriptional ArsR family regulator
MALCSSEKTVNELARPLEVSRPAVSQHLAVLKSVGLVTERRAGRSRCYRVRREGLHEIRQWLDSLDVFWSERMSRLGEHLDANP